MSFSGNRTLECNDENIKTCSDDIKNGKNVIFPTETVFGLGACAINAEAVSQIYKIKNRPTENPLIVHIRDFIEAKMYLVLDSNEEKIAETITKKYWPGPLTIVAKANSFIPDIVTANTGYVGMRSPSHPVAQKLLEFAMLPIAAPSANPSGRVSSTSKDHILNYFQDYNIKMLVPDEPCKFGIESTVVKIDNTTLTILRPGTITKEDLEDCVKNLDLNINILDKMITEQDSSPGTYVSHYSTTKKTVLFNFVDIDVDSDNNIDNIRDCLKAYLSKSVCIDFNSKNYTLREHFGAYVDLSNNGDINEALFNLYNVLHQIEHTVSIDNILIFDFYSEKDGLYKTLFDRVFRSASGKKILIPINILLENMSID